MNIIIFPGQGRRTGRVHIFDKQTGAYLTRGFVKGTDLYVKRDVDHRVVELRSFEGRRVDSTSTPQR